MRLSIMVYSVSTNTHFIHTHFQKIKEKHKGKKFNRELSETKNHFQFWHLSEFLSLPAFYEL